MHMSVALREFIKQTLSDILGGVVDAQQDPSMGKSVAPWGIGGADYPGKTVAKSINGALISVSFDVAVTAETSNAAKGGASVKVAVLGIGGSAGGELGTTSKNVAITRIQFEVPLQLPAGDRLSGT
jgi:hypothetical protein